MNNFLLAIGWWNFAGSIIMIGLFNPSFGKKMMNEWTKIFKEEFKLDFWGKFWMAWAIGLNIFFGLINIKPQLDSRRRPSAELPVLVRIIPI